MEQSAGDGGHARGSRGYRRTLVALWAAGIATFALLYYPQSILPLVGRDYGLTAADASLTVSGATIGLGATVLSWSWIADRIGYDRAMKISVVVAAVLGLLVPFAPSFPLLVVGRVVQGIALGGIPALALTYLSREIDRRHAVIAAGGYISGTAIGGLVGRLVAAPIAELGGWQVGALTVGIIATLSALVLAVTLPQARHRHATAGAPRGGTLRAVGAHLRNPALLALYAQAFLLMGAYVAVFNYLAYRLEDPPFSVSVSVTALIFLVSLVGMFSADAAGRLASRYGRRPVLLASTALMAAGAALTIPDSVPAILTGLACFTAAFFGAHAIASGWVGPTATIGPAQATALYMLFYYAGSSLFGWLTGLTFTLGWAAVAAMIITMTLVAFLTAWRILPGSRDVHR